MAFNDPVVASRRDAADADAFVEPAIDLVATWMGRAAELETAPDRKTMEQLGGLVSDDAGVGFVMQFVDRVARPDDKRVAAHQLESLVSGGRLPTFLSAIDRLLLRVGARLAPWLPAIVMPLANRRMRSIVGHLVAPAAPGELGRHLTSQRDAGYAINVNLLGEAVLGEREANARLRRLKDLIDVPDVDYVSVKITAVASQINHWAYADSLARITARLAELVDAAAAVSTPTFVNFDMEEYEDLELTVDAFKAVLSDPTRLHLDAGIVVQAYLPEALGILQDLTAFANERNSRGGGTIKIRLVKGANLAMERVTAAMHGWEQAPFGSKIESDAGFRACLDWALQPDRLSGVRIGIASHNLFDVAWAKLVADARGVGNRVQFEMLQGMASGQAKAVNEATRSDAAAPMLLYTPAVRDEDFDVAIGYLFRRLEENAAPANFMRKLFSLEAGSDAFRDEAEFFRQGVALRFGLDHQTRRRQNRARPPGASVSADGFRNEPDTDPSLRANREWIASIFASEAVDCRTPIVTTSDEVLAHVATARQAQVAWNSQPPHERREVLHRVAHELSLRRGELMASMMHEASKTIAEADVEVSEAIDFARWYGDRCVDLGDVRGAAFSAFGLIGVVPPWNFPVAIPAGGVLAALAAGNAVLLKPAPQTPRCAEIVAEACWAAGIPEDVLRFVPTPDDDVGRLVIESVDAVILTGSSETAELFHSWKPELRLFAETSGKNALIITPSADLDLAVEDLVRSAFGHAGQKCSAASLAILVGDVATSARFRRQLIDAVESLSVGSPHDPATDIAPLVGGGNERLTRAVSQLEPGERWLVQPRISADGVMSPGVRDGVAPGSWFHRTECFGPVLGLLAAADLDEAIGVANSSSFGLTGGIHSLDPAEVERWTQSVEVGNGYVNRAITGAIVQRQPFGGWKRSSVGPGAKAGGPNYLMQLGEWTPRSAVTDDYHEQWDSYFALDHDPSDLFCEANILRYRPLDRLGLRHGPDASPDDLALVTKAARLAGVKVDTSIAAMPNVDVDTSIAAMPDVEVEVDTSIAAMPDVEVDTSIAAMPDVGESLWIEQMHQRGVRRIRFVGMKPLRSEFAAANRLGIHLIAAPVTPAGRLEFLHLVREQALSITLHRFGNLVGAAV